MMRNLIFVVYDGILNSVFESQVLAPVIKMLDNGTYGRAYIISFETKTVDQNLLTHFETQHKNLSFIIIKRWKFISPFFLCNQIRKLRNFLKTLENYEIIARGALAGFIATKAINTRNCFHITIQARGLLEQEYRYKHCTCSPLLMPLYIWRARQYKKIEQFVYKKIPLKIPYVIESVSAALEEYLVHEFNLSTANIIQAQSDIPPIIPAEQISSWRNEIRADLGINKNMRVYCFSGASKSWQQPEMVISYFSKLYEQNKYNFLLVLTPDKIAFEKLLQKQVPTNMYRVISILHKHMYKYLAAADVGLVFREPGIVSWVARPVKAMEYEAVGLPIVHNNTVDWLLQRYGTNREFVG